MILLAVRCRPGGRRKSPAVLTDKENNDMKLTFVGDARNNVSNSLLIGCAKLGVNFAVAAPKELWPDEKLLEKMKKTAAENGSSILISDDIEEAVKGRKYHVIIVGEDLGY